VSTTPLLEVSHLFAGYETGVPIVRGASLEVRPGEIVVILGPNGAGKSTLIKAVAGLVPKFSGLVRLDGEDITGRPAHAMVRAGLAYVPQTENVFAGMSVVDNLRLASAVLAKGERRSAMQGVEVLFPDLKRQLTLRAGRLSGGQRQMLAIARALLVRPKLLMLDEASAGLSPKLVELVFNKIREIRDAGTTVLLVEQNARAALAVSDRAYVLVDGQNRHEGEAAGLRTDPSLGRLYLGGGEPPSATAGQP
jgi:branched-chain amino acid transport system ATP-binding protein